MGGNPLVYSTCSKNIGGGKRVKRRGFSAIQLEGLNVSLNDRSDFFYLGDKASLKEALFLSGRAKEAIFSEGGS